MTTNQALLNWVKEMTDMTKPDNIVWIDGSEEQIEQLKKEAFSTGEVEELNQEKLPGCVYHHTDPRDVARSEKKTFICSKRREDAGPTNNWMEPGQMKEKLKKLYDSCMKGRTCYVIPYSMSVIGSSFAKYGIELTDSIYVVLNMNVMTRVGNKVLEALGDSDHFIKGLHSKATLDEENKYIVQFPEENTIWSINSNYGGNALLGKKCFSLRIASCLARDEGWMAEHMLIVGIENPKGEVKYLAAAFPSGCGKTNLAMMIPPETYRKKGYKVWCVGDDIAWIRVGPDGRLWATNPENGFFGVAPGTSEKSNPNALATTHRDTIFTNVVKKADGTVWWEGLDKNPPTGAKNWLGEDWDPADGSKGAHPNARFTAPARNCPCLSKEFDNPMGVPLSAIVFGGRRAKTAPLVYQSFDWKNGVFTGSIMASETTTAADGKVGVVRRDPMAMLPFCGYNMGDYFQHWLDMEAKIKNPPKIFNVNWFRLDDDGNFIWPGYGENLRVVEWILKRCDDEVEAVTSPIGYLPRVEDLCIEGMDNMTPEIIQSLLAIDKEAWEKNIEGIREFYQKFDERFPAELTRQLENLEQRIETL